MNYYLVNFILWAASVPVATWLFLGAALAAVCVLIYVRTNAKSNLEERNTTQKQWEEEKHAAEWALWEPNAEVERIVKLGQTSPKEFSALFEAQVPCKEHYAPLPGEVVYGTVRAKLRTSADSLYGVTIMPGVLVVTSKVLYFDADNLSQNLSIPVSDVMVVNNWRDGISFACRSGKKHCFQLYADNPLSHPHVLRQLVRLVEQGRIVDETVSRVHNDLEVN